MAAEPTNQLVSNLGVVGIFIVLVFQLVFSFIQKYREKKNGNGLNQFKAYASIDQMKNDFSTLKDEVHKIKEYQNPEITRVLSKLNESLDGNVKVMSEMEEGWRTFIGSTQKECHTAHKAIIDESKSIIAENITVMRDVSEAIRTCRKAQ